MLKNIKYLFFGLAVLFSSCEKDDTEAEIAKRDEATIVQYLENNNLKTKAQRTNSGLYWILTDSTNTGVQAVNGKTVDVYYTGKFLDNRVFDSKTSGVPFYFVLGQGRVIQGWDEGIALLKKGQKARLFIPSKLAYGQSGQSTIPANTPLQFDVQLIDVK